VTEPEWKELSRYIRWCGDELGLRDWHFELLRDAPTGNSGSISATEVVQAQIAITYGRRLGCIYVGVDFRRYKPEVQRQCVVHELIHCHMDQIRSVIKNELFGSDRLTLSEYAMIKSAFVRAEENATDALAAAIAKQFPLIEWPKGGESKMTTKKASKPKKKAGGKGKC